MSEICIVDRLAIQGIYVRELRLGAELWGFVWLSSFSTYLLAINETLTREKKREVFFHELSHITCNNPEQSYFIGLDMQHTKIEKKADMVARKLYEITRKAAVF